MKELVRQGMRAGAAGLSVSRSPVQVGDHGEPMPGKVAEDGELFEVCKAVGEFGRGFFEFNPRVLIYEKDGSVSKVEISPFILPAQRHIGSQTSQ